MMEETSKYLSIIIPTYNVDQYIINTINSIINQDFYYYELILVDDGSNDNTPMICKLFAEQYDDRVIFIQCEHRGVSAARNEGIRKSCGRYIMFVDGDDYLAEDSLKLLYEILNSKQPDLLYFDLKRVDSIGEQPTVLDKNYIDPIIIDSHEAIIEKLNQKTIPCCCSCIHTNIIKDNNIFFDENLTYVEDALFLFSCLLHSQVIIHYEREMYYYYKRQGSATHLKEIPLSITKMELNAWKKIRRILKSDTVLVAYVNKRIKPIKNIYYKEALKETFPILFKIKRLLLSDSVSE